MVRKARSNPLIDDEDDTPAPPKRFTKTSGADDVINDDRIWIILEENKDIPPTGQFIGLNGRSWMLRAGVPAHVPKAIINVLNDAIKSVPVMEGDKIVEYRNAMRLPYRILTAVEAERFNTRQRATV